MGTARQLAPGQGQEGSKDVELVGLRRGGSPAIERYLTRSRATFLEHERRKCVMPQDVLVSAWLCVPLPDAHAVPSAGTDSSPTGGTRGNGLLHPRGLAG